jgi:glutathione peroxidase
MNPSQLYDITVKNIKGESEPLNKYQGKTLLIVNVASECGFTNQYEGLEKLHEQYADKGLVVMGFPCNQFGGQEPADEKTIESFCTTKFGIKFPMFEKVEVNGSNAHPLFQLLKKEATGLLGTEGIKWNFTKFLITKDGKQVTRFAPQTKPEDLKSDIEKAL